MRKMYDEEPDFGQYKNAVFYKCDHPLYNQCSLYLLPDGRGLAVVEKRWNARLKVSYWTAVRTDIVEEIFACGRFQRYLDRQAKQPQDGLYPTIPVRRVMWALGMPPLPKADWEKDFSDVAH